MIKYDIWYKWWKLNLFYALNHCTEKCTLRKMDMWNVNSPLHLVLRNLRMNTNLASFSRTQYKESHVEKIILIKADMILSVMNLIKFNED